ncbi:MAG: endopeptidase La [Lachnospiraceae bacterium]|nr:endopeptidase La [Lachnospiraceae bacterium]
MITIPVYNSIILPEVTYYYQYSYFMELAGDDFNEGEEIVFIFLKEEVSPEEASSEHFHDIGIYAVIEGVNDGGNVVVKTLKRVDIEDLEVNMDNFTFSFTERPYLVDLDIKKLSQKFKALKSNIIKYVSEQKWGFAITNYMMQWKSIEEIAVSMSSRLDITSEEKYEIIACDKQSDRVELIEKAVNQMLVLMKVTNEAIDATDEKNEKMYREDALKKQISFLQEQLDELHPENMSDVKRFEELIEKAGMNELALKEANKVLSRMKNEGKHSPEYGILYDYLDFVTELNWKKAEFKDIDINKAKKILDDDHYGLNKVKRRVLEQLAVMSNNKTQSGSILLFVGPPGTGKTSIGQSIAHALDREYVRISLGGVRDEAEIRGHRRTYIGAMAGRIMDGIRKCGASNPVIVLDEVDKLSRDFSGDPSSALLEVLDPEQNNTFTDHYLNVPYDLSDVFFLCTANTVDTIPEPLYNRMEVIDFNGYTENEKVKIAENHLIPKAYKTYGLTKSKLKIPEKTLRSIISGYTMESGVRTLKRRIDSVFRAASVKLVSGEKKSISVSVKALPEYIDMKPIEHDLKLKTSKPGVVTGLAWTMAGGEILFIETMLSKGSGEVIITGQLGDVMKESVQIAISLVKSMYPKEAAVLSDHDLHIHVPAGAVPKDGPSAGITITTALTSLILKKKAPVDIAMTGEVSLRGVVLPIGGLPEKLMAAQRAGIDKVFIPADNVRDLDDVSDETKDALTIVPVKEVSQVIKEVLG